MADAPPIGALPDTHSPGSDASHHVITMLQHLDDANPTATVAPPAQPTTLNDQLWRKAIPLLDPECRREYLEQFRQLRNRLLLYREQQLPEGQKLQVVAFLSASRGDGKSFTSGNLAAALAAASPGRVLLLDADPTSGRWHRRLEIDGDFGLSEVLAGSPWREAIFPSPSLDLDLMPLGTQRSSQLDRLDFHRLPALLTELRAHYDWILIDGPSFEDSADAELLGNLADGALLIVRQDRTSFAAVERMAASFRDSRLLGAIFNPGRR